MPNLLVGEGEGDGGKSETKWNNKIEWKQTIGLIGIVVCVIIIASNVYILKNGTIDQWKIVMFAGIAGYAFYSLLKGKELNIGWIFIAIIAIAVIFVFIGKPPGKLLTEKSTTKQTQTGKFQPAFEQLKEGTLTIPLRAGEETNWKVTSGLYWSVFSNNDKDWDLIPFKGEVIQYKKGVKKVASFPEQDTVFKIKAHEDAIFTIVSHK